MAKTNTARADATEDFRLGRQPLHQVAAWLIVVVTILFVSLPLDVKPMMELSLLVALIGATVVFAPRGAIPRLRIGLSAVVFLMVWMLSVVWSASPAIWWFEFRFYAAYIGAVTVATSSLSPRGVKHALLFAVYVAVAANVFASITDASTHQGVGGAGWRGAFVHKNAMGAFMGIAIVTALAFDRRPVRKWAATIAALILLLLSRSATAAALVVVAVPALWSMRQFGSVTPRRAATRFATVAGLALTLAIAGATQAPTVLDVYGKDLTFSSRTDIWTETIPYIRERPLFGWGAGVWRRRGISPAIDINEALGFQTAHAHNAGVETMLTLGLVGFLAFVFFWMSALRAGWRAAQAGLDEGAWTVAICIMLGLWGLSEITTPFHVALMTLGLILSIGLMPDRYRSIVAA